MPSEARRRLQTALPQQTATVFRHTAHYPVPSRTKIPPRQARDATIKEQ
ncbi:hypothetical protein [Neisseria lactamica]|nr:hypothetical protein [Neisseria lactamica]